REEVAAARAARIVDQNVEAAEFTRQCIDQRRRFGVCGEISGVNDRLAAQRANLVRNDIERLGVACGQHHVAAARRELKRNTAADTATSAGDQSDLAGEFNSFVTHADFNRL